MTIVDSHCHVSTVWFEPLEPRLFQMDRHGVEQAVLMQMFRQPDNRYLLESASQHLDRLSPVVIVDSTLPNAPQTLTKLKEQGAAGVRLTTANHTDTSGAIGDGSQWPSCSPNGPPTSANDGL